MEAFGLSMIPMNGTEGKKAWSRQRALPDTLTELKGQFWEAGKLAHLDIHDAMLEILVLVLLYGRSFEVSSLKVGQWGCSVRLNLNRQNVNNIRGKSL